MELMETTNFLCYRFAIPLRLNFGGAMETMAFLAFLGWKW
jgi:hypothetical protein